MKTNTQDQEKTMQQTPQEQQAVLDTIATATDRQGKKLATWFPSRLRDAIAHAQNYTFTLVPEWSSYMDVRVVLELRRGFPLHEQRKPLERCDRLVVEAVAAPVTQPDGRLHLAQRAGDGALTLVYGQEEETQDFHHPRVSVMGEKYESKWRLFLIDISTGREIAAESVWVLGSVVAHSKPDLSPVEYGGCKDPQQADVIRSERRYEALFLRDESMQPAFAKDSYVVVDKDAAPFNGAIVAAIIDHSRPKPKFWQREALRDWSLDPEDFDYERCGYTLRQFWMEGGHITLQPLAGAGHASWVDGSVDEDGWRTEIRIMGVATRAQVFATSGSLVVATMPAEDEPRRTAPVVELTAFAPAHQVAA